MKTRTEYQIIKNKPKEPEQKPRMPISALVLKFFGKSEDKQTAQKLKPSNPFEEQIGDGSIESLKRKR